ncbi:MAG: T9SS type A sorting domain-containing protein [Aureispira sp.]|nr:T9SS type A sorting domain-containing protein [Aureispira sp.]
MIHSKYIILFISLFASFQLIAVNRTWTGAVNNDFNTVGNWTGGGALAAGDNFTVTLTNSTTITLSADITVNNLDFNGNSSNGSGIVLSRLDVLNRTLTVNGTFICNAVRYTNSSQRDEVQIDAGSGGFIFNGTATFHNGGDGDVFIEADAASQGTMTFNSTLTLGDWAYTSPGVEPDFIYDAPVAQNINYSSNSFVVPASMIFGNSNSPTVTYGGTGSTTSFSTYDGNFTTNNNSVANINEFDCNAFFGASMTLNNGSELQIGGDSDFPTSYTTTTIGATSRVTYDGPSAQTVTAQTYGHIEFGGSNAKTSAGDFSILGDWTNNGTFAHGNDVHTFNGTIDQTIEGSNLTTFYTIIENKASGNILLDRDAEAVNQITLTSGGFDLNGHDMYMDNTATNAIGRTDGYVISERTDMTSTLSWRINSVTGGHIFPFGTAAGTYIPFTYERVASSQGVVSVATYPTVADDNIPYAPTVTHMDGIGIIDNSASAVNRFWDIDVAGTMNANLTYTYADAEVPGNGEVNLRAQQWDAGAATWLEPTTNIASQASDPATNTVTANGVTNSASNWTLALDATLLQVELAYFTGKCDQTNIQLNWATNTEKNNDFFSIERSFDAVNFELVAKVEAEGNSSTLKNYSFTDNSPFQQTQSYYRLKQNYKNGKFLYSDIISVSSCVDGNFKFVPYQKNADVVLNMSSDNEGKYNVDIIDLTGKILYNNSIRVISGTNSIHLSPSLGSGYYLIRLTSTETKETYSRKIQYIGK